MPTWKRSGGTCFLLRRLWTCSVALLEKGCGARRGCVTPGRWDGGTGPTQGCTNEGVNSPQHSTHVGAGQQLLHDVMVKDVAAPGGSLLLRVQLFVLLDLVRAQIHGTALPRLHRHGAQPHAGHAQPTAGSPQGPACWETGPQPHRVPHPAGWHPRLPGPGASPPRGPGHRLPWVPRAHRIGGVCRP